MKRKQIRRNKGNLSLWTLQTKDRMSQSCSLYTITNPPTTTLGQSIYNNLLLRKSFATEAGNFQAGDLKTKTRVNKLTNILNTLYTKKTGDGYECNHKNQEAIERLLFDQYQLLFSEYKGYSVGNIPSDLLTPKLKGYILSKVSDLSAHTKRMKLYYSDIKEIKLRSEREIFPIVKELEADFLLNLCLLHFLIILTYHGSDDKEKLYTTHVAMDIGKKMVRKYLYTLKSKDNKLKGQLRSNVKYSDWYNETVCNTDLANKTQDNQVIAGLGFLIIQILEYSGMIKNQIVVKSRDEQYYVLSPSEEASSDGGAKHLKQIINLPLKLPMIVKPKPYGKDLLGGYLLNDDYYKEELIIDKNIIKDKSYVRDDNIIYSMINNINSVAFKINNELLAFILDPASSKHELLLDPHKPHKYEDIVKRTKYQQGKYSSHISQLILQDVILGLADFYKNFDQIYFPVRLDQRGRVYCNSSYLNYQSSELARALLLFKNPGIINKSYLDDVKYLQIYGVNCFGKDKLSDSAKIKWVEANQEDIINYDNGKLISKAKEKFMFIAFCMEYKRYINFINDERSFKFHSYLPIQLDATCNGFQHLALLSNESTLFKELNLQLDNKNEGPPKDFYNFLVYKLGLIFESGHSPGVSDSKDDPKNSFERLNKFNIDRGCIKKAIMTIPYNVSQKRMREYIQDSLFLVDKEKHPQGADASDEPHFSWYSKCDQQNKPYINFKDICLLVSTIHKIVNNDFEKIKKLMKYLRNIATILSLMGLPIVWSLPHGLTVRQSYLEVKSTSIKPFLYSQAKINIQVVNREKYDKAKQVRALMPNLIHSLDASSLSLLYEKFHNLYEEGGHPQFLSIHDCFGTTLDKVSILKTLLASVYMDIYSTDPYLDKFDNDILNFIEYSGKMIDREKRLVEIVDKDQVKEYELHSIEWVKNKKDVNKGIIKRIDSQYILI